MVVVAGRDDCVLCSLSDFEKRFEKRRLSCNCVGGWGGWRALLKKNGPALTVRNGDKMSSPPVLRISLKMCSVLECELGRGLGTGGHGSPAKGAEGGGKTAKTKKSHMHNPAQG